MRSMEACHRKLTMTSWAGHQSWSSYSYRRSCPRNSMPIILWSFGIGNKLERWKSTVSGCFMRPQQIKKVIIWNDGFSCSVQQQWIIPQAKLSCVMKSEIYVTTGDDQLGGWTEKNFQSTSQSQTGTEKGHGHCSVVCCWPDPLQLSESQWNHYLWEECSASQWDASQTATSAGRIAQQKGTNSFPRQHPAACLTASASKVEQIGLRSFASSTILTWSDVVNL